MELREQAVLMRTSHDSDLLELELSRRQIPFVKYGGLRYLEAAHVKDLIALFRLADNPADEMSWFRVLQLLEGVGPATARRALDVLVAARRRSPGRAGRRARERLPAPTRAPPATRRSRRCGERRAEPAAPARAPSGCATRSRRSIAATTPTARVRLAGPRPARGRRAARRRTCGHFVAELVLDPPPSSADLAGPPHLDED